MKKFLTLVILTSSIYSLSLNAERMSREVLIDLEDFWRQVENDFEKKPGAKNEQYAKHAHAQLERVRTLKKHQGTLARAAKGAGLAGLIGKYAKKPEVKKQEKPEKRSHKYTESKSKAKKKTKAAAKITGAKKV